MEIRELEQDELQALEAHAKTIALKYGISKVHVYVAYDSEIGEFVHGFYKEPSYTQKLFAMDKIATVGTFAAGEELRQALTLTGEGESHPFIYQKDEYKLAIVGLCIGLIQVAQNQFKKK
ncbi:hypothetical protein UFOVP129_28 [uncultured Caudovirales phage]|uniref:Uncharacterized protein n=1 Tax=uncultured Caudovirales phage TaxID=2100421 RepID=A0A6J5L8K2_9CAUD|nr:hypothetical protein UFOVP129_28 [uncultured Caudovirales phage]